MISGGLLSFNEARHPQMGERVGERFQCMRLEMGQQDAALAPVHDTAPRLHTAPHR